ncbi:MAG: SDR family oxidoreductase [Eubacteriales bacterium]
MELKTAVITGGANGIGRRLAEKFVENGYQVAVVDTDAPSGELLASQLGDKLFFYCGDITQQTILEGFADEVAKRFGQVHALINNACASRGGLSDCEWEDFNYILRLGISAPFYLTKLLCPIFAKGASVVNISSTRAFMSQPDTESYTAAKGGISALTHALCVSLSGRARVNCISPGWIDTSSMRRDGAVSSFSEEDKAQHPSGRIGSPDDIADLALFLCSDSAGFINGENIIADGGMSRLMIYHGDHGWSYKSGV